MTEQSDTPRARPEPQHVIATAENDWFLQFLVSIVNKSDASFPITLFVGGLLVSGQLVGGKKFFEGFGAAFGGGHFPSPRPPQKFAKISRNSATCTLRKTARTRRTWNPLITSIYRTPAPSIRAGLRFPATAEYGGGDVSERSTVSILAHLAKARVK